MRAILEFDCTDEEDEMKMKRTLLAEDLCHVIHEMQGYLRKKVKYAQGIKSAEEELEEAQQFLADCLIDNGLDMNKIYR